MERLSVILEFPPERIGIVMLSSVGNTVHTLPVVIALKRAYPRARITWIMQPSAATLVRGHPAVDEILLFDRRRGWRGFLALQQALSHREFDVVLDLQSYLKAGLVTKFTRAAVKLGFDRGRARDLNWLFTTHRLPPNPVQHVQDQFLEFLDALEVPREPVRWDLGPWPQERAAQRAFFERLDRPAATLVIGSSREETSWVPERWAELADVLATTYGLRPVLVGGSSPREMHTRRVVERCMREDAISAMDCGLRNLVGILDGSALVVSLDTGPLHMAVALDRPVVSLLGYSDPGRTGPYRKFQDLVVDAYHGRGEAAPVSAEVRRGRMGAIEVTDVLERVDRWKERYARAEGGTGAATLGVPPQKHDAIAPSFPRQRSAEWPARRPQDEESPLTPPPGLGDVASAPTSASPPNS